MMVMGGWLLFFGIVFMVDLFGVILFLVVLVVVFCVGYFGMLIVDMIGC